MRGDFEDKVAVVTGSAQGLGAAVARQFAELIDRDSSPSVRHQKHA